MSDDQKHAWQQKWAGKVLSGKMSVYWRNVSSPCTPYSHFCSISPSLRIVTLSSTTHDDYDSIQFVCALYGEQIRPIVALSLPYKSTTDARGPLHATLSLLQRPDCVFFPSFAPPST